MRAATGSTEARPSLSASDTPSLGRGDASPPARAARAECSACRLSAEWHGRRAAAAGPRDISCPGDRALSRRHCEMHVSRDGRVRVRDVGSTGGTRRTSLRIS